MATSAARQSTIAWAQDVSGNFSTAANWRGGVVPGASDEAFLDAAGGAAYTVTLNAGNAQTGGIKVGSIRAAANATLSLDNAGESNGNYDEIFANLYTLGALTNVGYDVEASGFIKGSLYNDSYGYIDAGASSLKIDTTASVINEGDFGSQSSGRLIIETTTVQNNGGRIEIGVILDGADIQGGSVGAVQVRGAGNVIDGSVNAVTLLNIVVAPGANLVGQGLIDNEGKIIVKGSATLEGSVDNTGRIQVGGGTLTVNGAVSGGGEAVINGGTLTFASTFEEKVGFQGAGTLVLGESQDYTGTIQHFATDGTTALDLEDVSFADAGEATFSGDSKGGVLTVAGANGTAVIHLAGDYLGVTFTAASADGGDTSVITASTTAAASRLVQAAAAFAPTSDALTTSSGPSAAPPAGMTLAAPVLAMR